MSEDSDYTSDVNYPLQHQYNASVHQYGGIARNEQWRMVRQETIDQRDYYPRSSDLNNHIAPEYEQHYEKGYERGCSIEQSFSQDYDDYQPAAQPIHPHQPHNHRPKQSSQRYPQLESFDSYDRSASYDQDYYNPESDSEPLYYNSRPKEQHLNGHRYIIFPIPFK